MASTCVTETISRDFMNNKRWRNVALTVLVAGSVTASTMESSYATPPKSGAKSTKRQVLPGQRSHTSPESSSVGPQLGDDYESKLREHTRDSLTNLGLHYKEANAHTLAHLGGKSPGFAGIIDPETEEFLLFPSGTTTVGGVTPSNSVPARGGGHAIVNRKFSELKGLSRDSRTTYGFTVLVNQDGSLYFKWRSGSVNEVNHGHEAIPGYERLRVKRAVEQATGRIEEVNWSDEEGSRPPWQSTTAVNQAH
jgi:hypothetical protein